MASSLQIAMIIQGYLPRTGGAERQIAALAPLQQQRGISIQVYTRRYPGLRSYEVIGGVPVHRIPSPGPKAAASISYTLGTAWMLLRSRPDVIHAHELLSPTTAAVAARQMLGTPVAVKILRGGLLGDIAKLKSKPLGRRRLEAFCRQVDVFIAISREIEQELQTAGVGPNRQRFIPNGVDTRRFRPLPPAEKWALRHTLGIHQAPLAVFSGRLAPEKRVNELIRLWPEVQAAHPQASLLVLGTGEQEIELQRQAGPGVSFAGQVEDVAPYLQAADLFILPSATEGLSNAMLEALSSGLAVIATRVGGAGDVITHKQSGWLVEPGQADGLRSAILEVLDDAALRDSLGKNARQAILESYSLEQTAGKLSRLYTELKEKQR